MGTGAHYALFLIAFAFAGFGLALQVRIRGSCTCQPTLLVLSSAPLTNRTRASTISARASQTRATR